MANERRERTIEEKINEIRQRMQNASQPLKEEEHGWIINEELSRTNPAGCRVYSPVSGFTKEADYQLFLHAAEDIRYLLVLLEKPPKVKLESIHEDDPSRHER